jgi:hypothetical protein
MLGTKNDYSEIVVPFSSPAKCMQLALSSEVQLEHIERGDMTLDSGIGQFANQAGSIYRDYDEKLPSRE